VPEGDTIHRTAQALHRALIGGTVTRFESAYPHLNRVDTDAPVVGRTIDAVTAHGKHLLVHFSGALVLRTHMRMSGRWHVYRPGERWRAPSWAVRIVIGTAQAVAVALDVVDAEFRDTRRAPRTDVLADLGPDLLSGHFDEDEAVRRLQARGEMEIADALLDQRVMAGVGNVFKSEILFVSGIHPRAGVRSLDEEALRTSVRAARRLLLANAGRPANPRAGYRNTTGRLNPAERLWVYGRRGRPCLRCGTPVASAKQGVGARTTFWCPQCQPQGAPRPPEPSLTRGER
jgi:endonuclease-8